MTPPPSDGADMSRSTDRNSGISIMTEELSSELGQIGAGAAGSLKTAPVTEEDLAWLTMMRGFTHPQGQKRIDRILAALSHLPSGGDYKGNSEFGQSGSNAADRPGTAPSGGDDHYPSHEALSDLVHLLSEESALNGGGPDWKQRWDRAWRIAEDLVRVEP